MGKVKEWADRNGAFDGTFEKDGPFDPAIPNGNPDKETWEGLYVRAETLVKSENKFPDVYTQLLALIKLQHQTIEELKARIHPLEQRPYQTHDIYGAPIICRPDLLPKKD